MDKQRKTDNSEFEEGLKEILSSGENRYSHKNDHTVPNNEKNVPASQNKQILLSYSLLRIIAALTALGLLILFGLQIAQR